ncbi:MAG: metal ABC transporter permease [Acidobacteria bacterium]|jgi:zinc/manganese transport system permease protein|nr:metal ABC transporter permease [Acidobacteriota bacterium]
MLHFVELLGLPFLVCVAMTAVLGYLGIHVLSREIVFVDIALAQIVAVGAIGAHLAFGVEGHSLLTYVASLALALGAAAFYALARRKVLQISQEAVIGVSYAIAAATALFLIGIAPGGHVHTQHMLAGSILWASWTDLLLCVVVFGAVGICFSVLRHPFQRISRDYDGAVRDGMKVVAWDFLFYALLGVVITFAVRIGGVVVVFAFLIIPATVSALFTGHVGKRLLITWGAGTLGALLGLLFAHRLDFSVGPAVALFLGVELALAGLWRRSSPSLAGAVAVVVSVGYVALLVAAPSPHGVSRSAPGVSAPPPTDVATAETAPAASDPSAELLPGSNERVTTASELAALFERTPDPETRRDIVLRALDVEPRCGAQLALRYLQGDPPLFFRQGVIDGLGEPLDWDVMQPFAASVNAEAAERLREKHRLDALPPPCQ